VCLFSRLTTACFLGPVDLYFEKQIGVYKVIKKIGKGRYGLVKLGENVQTGAKVAIKIVNKARLNDVEKSAIRTEAEVMTILSHPNVIRLHEVIETSHEICMIMDYAASGDLFDYLVKRRRLKEKEAHRIFLQICNGVSYCHRHYIVHRDIKAENIFLDEDLNVRIGDWGFSSIFHPGSKIETHCGSLEYAAPEVLSGSAPLSFSVDVWSLGAFGGKNIFLFRHLGCRFIFQARIPTLKNHSN
jgi:serine/threonine protein kinase